jgi:hypothetical protein
MTNQRKYKLGHDINLDEEVVLDRHGQRITEERAQEMAEYALKQVRRGRPSLTSPARHSPQVSFRVPADLAKRANELADRQGKTLSELGREALERYVDESA